MQNHYKLLYLNSNLKLQRGQTLLVLLVLLVLGFGASFYVFISPTNSSVERNKITIDVLSKAKTALIGYAASHGTRPGTFPCPDLNNDGLADNYSGNECTNYISGSNVYFGRLPWQTLGLPDLRDDSGERLWYAVSREFAINPSCTPNCSSALSSDSVGQLTITGTAPTSNAIAVIFSPGSSLSSQLRSASNENAAINYLENENSDGNNSTFTVQSNSTTFNDKLLAITSDELMPVVEQRVALEMIGYLNLYRNATGIYPWADLGDGDSNGVPYDYAYNRNRFPCRVAAPINWGSGGTPVLPNWLKEGCLLSPPPPLSGWTSIIYYGVARDILESGGAGCTTSNCANSITVNNSTNNTVIQCSTSAPPICAPTTATSGNIDLILMTPGAFTGGPVRNWSQTTFSSISGYFYDPNSAIRAENTDNNDNIYSVPSTTEKNRTRIFIVR